MNLITQQALTKREKFVISLAVLAVVSFIVFFYSLSKPSVKVSQTETNQINYEMAKMNSSEAMYSLEGRDIERDVEGLPVVSSKSQPNAPLKVSKETKAQADAKKAAAAKAAAAKKAAAKKIVAKPNVTPAAHPSTAQNRTSDSNMKTSSDQNSAQQAYVPSAESAEATETPPTPPKKAVKTYAEWKAEILKTGSKESILALAAALKKDEITKEEYYQLVKEMLKSQDEKFKGLGLYALRAVTSYESYAMLIKVQAEQNQTYQQYIQDALLSYHQSGGLMYMKQALMSTDRTVVVKTLEILKLGLTKIQSGSAEGLGDARYRREPSYASNFTLQNYTGFLPALTQLGQAGDQEISASVQQIAQMIQTTQTVAAN